MIPIIDGDPGSWADAIANSPCLNVSDYARGDHAEGFGVCPEADCGQPAGTVCTYALCPGKRRALSPFHSRTSSPGAQRNHGL